MEIFNRIYIYKFEKIFDRIGATLMWKERQRINLQCSDAEAVQRKVMKYGCREGSRLFESSQGLHVAHEIFSAMIC